jgi:pantoate kinase
MSSAKFTISRDEELQIIRQTIEGIIDEEDSKRILEMTVALANGLKDPNNVRVLTVSNDFGKATSRARKQLMKNLNESKLHKMAVMGKNPFMKTLITFIVMATGLKKVKLFTGEKEALDWLAL